MTTTQNSNNDIIDGITGTTASQPTALTLDFATLSPEQLATFVAAGAKVLADKTDSKTASALAKSASKMARQTATSAATSRTSAACGTLTDALRQLVASGALTVDDAKRLAVRDGINGEPEIYYRETRERTGEPTDKKSVTTSPPRRPATGW